MSSTPSAMIQIGLRQFDQALFSVIKGPCMCSVTLLDAILNLSDSTSPRKTRTRPDIGCAPLTGDFD